SATADPTTCHGFKRTEGNGNTGANPIPNKNSIVTGPCQQVVPPGTKITQGIKLGKSACGKNPVQVFVIAGGEQDVTSVLAPGSTGLGGGESTTVGEYLTQPFKISMKKYKNCVTSNEATAKKSARQAALPATIYPVSCSGSVTPFNGVRGPDTKVSF